MQRERRKRTISVISAVTTGVLIACIVWYGLTRLVSGESLKEAEIPYMTLPQILLLGILCGVESELMMPGDDRPPRKYWRRYALHYVTVTATALICGYFFEWYEPTVSGVLLMCLTSVGIYLFASYLKYRSGKKDADAMNACLKEMRENDKKVL